jgi:aldehyde dehydrogenase (NAD+)
MALANDTEFGLCRRQLPRPPEAPTHFKRHVQAGMVMVNLPTAGVDYHVPFGGSQRLQLRAAREQGRYAAEFYTTVPRRA